MTIVGVVGRGTPWDIHRKHDGEIVNDDMWSPSVDEPYSESITKGFVICCPEGYEKSNVKVSSLTLSTMEDEATICRNIKAKCETIIEEFQGNCVAIMVGSSRSDYSYESLKTAKKCFKNCYPQTKLIGYVSEFGIFIREPPPDNDNFDDYHGYLFNNYEIAISILGFKNI